MATGQITNFPNGVGDGLSIDSKILLDSADGSKTRSVSIRELLEYLGIPVDALASLSATGDNRLAFGTDVRKIGEGAAAGTGSLLMGVDQTGWDRVSDDSAATT